MFYRSLFVLLLVIVLSVRHRLTGSDYPIGIFKFFLWTLSNERLDINQGLSIECWKTTTLPINILLSVIDPDFQNKDLFRTYIHTNVLPPVATRFLPVITDHIYRGSFCSQMYFYFGLIFRVAYLWFWIVILSFSKNSCILLCLPVTWYILVSVDAFKPADVYCWNRIIQIYFVFE